MIKRNGENERVKRRYLVYLKEAKGRDNASIDAAAGAVERFEEYVKRRDFRNFHIEQARGFKAHLLAATNTRNGKPLSASTVHGTLAAVKAFFVWLADQPGYAARIKYADAEYFNAPDNLSRIATARRFKSCPTLAQVRAMIDALANETEIEKRDRALVAFTILSGARDRAIVSFRLKHIDIERGRIEQDSREVRTKRAKTFTSWFFPVGEDIRRIVVDWVAFLREEKGFGPDDPLFPKSKVTPGMTLLSVPCPSIAHLGLTLTLFAISSAKPVRERVCHISILTCSGTRLFRSPMTGSSTPKHSRRGRRTSGTKAV
jgi:site-specific recombinase XerD